MKASSRFMEELSKWSLKFKDPNLETRFVKEKAKEFARCWPRGLVLMVLAAWDVNALVRLVLNYNNGNTTLFNAGLAAILTGLLAVILEFTTHAISWLEYARGFFLCSGVIVMGTIYGSFIHRVPALMPGSVTCFVLGIFSNLYFASDFRFAILNQFFGQAAATTFLAIRYSPTMAMSDLIIPLINLNSLLLFVPLFFYFAERDKRQIAFHASLTSRVLPSLSVSFASIFHSWQISSLQSILPVAEPVLC